MYLLNTFTHWFSYCVSMVTSLGTLASHSSAFLYTFPFTSCQISSLLTYRHLIHAKQEGFLYPHGERERSQHSDSTCLWRYLSPWTRDILLATLEGLLTSDRKSQGKWAVSEQCHMLDSWFLLLFWSHHCTCWLLQTFPCRAELASTPLARPHLTSDVVCYRTATGSRVSIALPQCWLPLQRPRQASCCSQPTYILEVFPVHFIFLMILTWLILGLRVQGESFHKIKIEYWYVSWQNVDHIIL